MAPAIAISCQMDGLSVYQKYSLKILEHHHAHSRIIAAASQI
jgi:hypothetical protein